MNNTRYGVMGSSSYWRIDQTKTDEFFRTLSVLFDEPAPGAPECEKFSDIAKSLKEIEAERQRAAQAATLPEEKK